MDKFYSNLKKQSEYQQENPKKYMPRQIIKLPKTKDKEARKKKHMTYRRRIKMSTAVSSETTEDGRKWQKEKKLSIQNSVANKNTL